MKYIENSRELIEFIRKSASMFHTVNTIKSYLDKENFIEIKESENWNLEKGKNYYTTRNDSSIIAFKIGEELSDYHFQLVASHTDSPTFKVKSVAELEGVGGYLKLNVESYGGMIDSTWFDKPLTLAGRVLIEENNLIKSKLLYIDKDILIIPNIPIHLNRSVNDGYKFNRQIDLIPLVSAGEMKKGDYDKMIAKELGIEVEQIISKDLFLVNRQDGKIWGYENEFVSTPKLDDLECAFTSLKAFIEGSNSKAVNVYACFDNEEVGSNTKQGAMSTFLYDTLTRLNKSLGFDMEEYHKAVSKSFLISADNAHGVHPNHKELYDEGNRTFMNKGIVIKEAANQKYTSDAFSQAVFKKICQLAEVPVQNFANRSDVIGGSTLGNLSNTQVSLHAVDIGLAQLSMHSSYETAGTKDVTYMIEAIKKFYNSNVKIKGASEITIE